MITARWLARVLLKRPQLDQIAIKCERGTVPHVTIDTIAEHWNLVDVRCIDSGAAFGPEKIDEAILRKRGMQSDAEQTALRSIVDGEIEWRAVQDAVDDSLHLSGRLFQNEKIVWSNEGHVGRLI